MERLAFYFKNGNDLAIADELLTQNGIEFEYTGIYSSDNQIAIVEKNENTDNDAMTLLKDLKYIKNYVYYSKQNKEYYETESEFKSYDPEYLEYLNETKNRG